MEKLIFETNVKNDNFLPKVNKAVRKIEGIKTWKIELDSIYNLLTVEGKCLDHREIVSQLSMQGIEASRLYED